MSLVYWKRNEIIIAISIATVKNTERNMPAIKRIGPAFFNVSLSGMNL